MKRQEHAWKRFGKIWEFEKRNKKKGFNAEIAEGSAQRKLRSGAKVRKW